MSFDASPAAFTSLSQTPRSSERFADELASLVEEIQSTRDWFNAQMNEQLASLHQLRASMHADDEGYSTPMATLFEAPHPVVVPPEPVEPAAPVAIKHQHQAIVLAPTMAMTLDPQLEQATLHELNHALSRAFSEISSRGGMLG